MFTVTIDTRSLESAVAVANRDLVRDVRGAVREACVQGAATARVTAPHRSYELRDSIDHRMIRAGAEGAEGEIKASAEHASYMRDGTRPHEIVPRRRQFLRFEADGDIVFARRVQHPGTQPHDFWKKCESTADRTLNAKVSDAVDQFCSRISR